MEHRRLRSFSLFGLAMVASLSLVSSCSKTADNASQAPTAPAAGMSATSAAIASHLESGGELFAVMDVKGDLEKNGNLAADILGFSLQQNTGLMGMPASTASLDYRALVKKLGLYNIEGFGLSSWKGEDGLHHSRSFLYTPNGRTGILKLLGDKPGPFVSPGLAPADADLVVEGTFDGKSLVDLIVSYAQDVSGPAAVKSITDTLKTTIPGTTLTGQAIVDHLNTRFTLIVRADTKQLLQVDPATKIPLTDFVIALDGFSDVYDQLEEQLKGAGLFTMAEKNGMKTATLDFPIPDPFQVYKPMLISDPKSKRLYVVSNEAFANATVFGQGARLSTSEDFKAATTGLPTEGNWLGYLSKKGAATIVQYYETPMMANLPPKVRDSYLDFAGLDKIPHGLASTQTNLADGFLAQSVSNRSVKDAVLLLPALMTAAFVDGAVAGGSRIPFVSGMGPSPTVSRGAGTSDAAIKSNLQQIAAGAMQYMLDKNVTEVRYQDLTSGATPYVHDISSVAGENYTGLIIRQTTSRISVTTADGRIISFDM